MELQDLETNVAHGQDPRGQEGEADAAYQKSLQHLQDGRWQEAIAGFQEVLRLQPDHVEAGTLLEETRLKASLDEHKPKPKRSRLAFQGPVKYLALTLVAVGVLLFWGAGLRWAYNRWVKPIRASQRVEIRKAQQLEQAYEYLAERDYVAAEQAFRLLLAEDPTNEEAQKGLADVQKKVVLAEDYSKAEQAIAQQNWEEASRLLESIATEDPTYRDVQTKVIFVREQQQLSAYFDKAEQAYRASNWQGAISAYEMLRNLDSEYQKPTLTQHLFESCLNQGIYLVQSTKGNSETVQEAQNLYQKALTLQPQQPQAMQEIALANKYLEGQTRLAQGDLEEAKDALEWVCQQQPDYAGGNAAALLRTASGEAPEAAPTPSPGTTPPAVEGGFQEQYAHWMQQGDTAIASSNYVQAEQYYREATTVAVHGGRDSARWLFASYAKLGTAQARNGSYEQAVQPIKTAIQVMSKSAVAIPSSSYSDYIERGDRYAEDGDYENALAQYEEAVQVFNQKCNCGLENWGILK